MEGRGQQGGHLGCARVFSSRRAAPGWFRRRSGEPGRAARGQGLGRLRLQGGPRPGRPRQGPRPRGQGQRQALWCAPPPATTACLTPVLLFISLHHSIFSPTFSPDFPSQLHPALFICFRPLSSLVFKTGPCQILATLSCPPLNLAAPQRRPNSRRGRTGRGRPRGGGGRAQRRSRSRHRGRGRGQGPAAGSAGYFAVRAAGHGQDDAGARGGTARWVRRAVVLWRRLVCWG